MFRGRGAEVEGAELGGEVAPEVGAAGGEALGAGGQFERRLQHDLQHFATMVEQAPPGALDPTSSAYLFHSESAASKGQTTLAQDESMGLVGGDVDRETIATTTPSTTDVVRDEKL